MLNTRSAAVSRLAAAWINVVLLPFPLIVILLLIRMPFSVCDPFTFTWIMSPLLAAVRAAAIVVYPHPLGQTVSVAAEMGCIKKINSDNVKKRCFINTRLVRNKFRSADLAYKSNCG